MSKKTKENHYGETLNLPKTDFPMRGQLPQREPRILEYWKEIDLYTQAQDLTKGREQFILHDGPPYANGDIHLGHTLNKVIKDMIVKSKSMQGYDAPYVPGWDTHGLPIENKAIEQVGLDAQTKDVLGFRKACHDYAMSYVHIQKEQFKRLGVRGDWENPYLTLSPEFEAEEIGVFGAMAQKGYIYKGLKPVYWCPHDVTALAEAEIEYGEERSPSIYVKFPVKDGKGKVAEDRTYFVIWTTTPWTLPANLAVALHKDVTYVVAKYGEDHLIIAKDLVEAFGEATGMGMPEGIVKEVLGADLEYVEASHPFYDRTSLVILGDHVTLESGTGVVHTAPGHGQEDYVVGQKYGLDILSPVDDYGKMTAEGLVGLSTDEANKVIGSWLEEKGLLVHLSFITHQYPHCWRCKTPTLFRSTPQWFASIDGFRQAALEAIQNDIVFTPEWGRERIFNMVRDRSDWTISRQRTWGVPIPVFYCQGCDYIVMEEGTIARIQDIVREKGTDAWFAMAEKDLLPEGYTCPKCGSSHFEKETDIMDVWFDSGSSHQGVLKIRPELRWPADLYLEGSDQHRGWFNSSLSTSVAMTGKAPYKGLLTHGFLVDEQGRKMSKSLGNGVDPLEVIEKQGADILRLWVSSTDYRSDVSVSPNILKQVADAYRKIRNTFRYILGNLHGFDPAQDRVAFADMVPLDQWILMKTKDLVTEVTRAYNAYEFHVVYREIFNFCNLDLSAVYFDIIKDRLYSEPTESRARRSAQTVLYDIGLTLVRLLAPILAFTTEEVFTHLDVADKPDSVQLMGWPDFSDLTLSEDFVAKWDRLLDIRDEVAKPLEVARRDKVIGNSLDAQVLLSLPAEDAALLDQLGMSLEDFLIVSQAHVVDERDLQDPWASEDISGLLVQVSHAAGNKCPRCWKYTEDIGQDAQDPDICARCAGVLAKA